MSPACDYGLSAARAALADLTRREAEHAAGRATALVDLTRREIALIVELRDLMLAHCDALQSVLADARAIYARRQTATAHACRPVRILVDADADAARIRATYDDEKRMGVGVLERIEAYNKALAAVQARVTELAEERAAVEHAVAMPDIEKEREVLREQEKTALAYIKIHQGEAAAWAAAAAAAAWT